MCLQVMEGLWDMDVARSLTAKDKEAWHNCSTVRPSSTACTDHCVQQAQNCMLTDSLH